MHNVRKLIFKPLNDLLTALTVISVFQNELSETFSFVWSFDEFRNKVPCLVYKLAIISPLIDCLFIELTFAEALEGFDIRIRVRSAVKDKEWLNILDVFLF